MPNKELLSIEQISSRWHPSSGPGGNYVLLSSAHARMGVTVCPHVLHGIETGQIFFSVDRNQKVIHIDTPNGLQGPEVVPDQEHDLFVDFYQITR